MNLLQNFPDKPLISTFFLAAILCFSRLVFASGLATQTVDSAGIVGEYISLAVDANGNPHISYYDRTNTDLKYAKRIGGVWSIQTVASVGNVGLINSLALDSAGNPHISYNGAGGFGGLRYAKWAGGVWSIQTVDPVAAGFYSTSLALNSQGQPRIAYTRLRQNGDPYLVYAEWTGTDWVIQTPNGTSGWFVASASLALDGAGNPHIAYAGSGAIFYAKRIGGVWSSSLAAYPGTDPSLVLDSGGNPHISFSHVTVLKYTKWTGSGWTAQTVDGGGGGSIFFSHRTSLALDGIGNPHIAYYNATNKDLKYAQWTGGAWVAQTVDSVGDIGQFPSLRIDGVGVPHFGYFDEANGDLKYATRGQLCN